LHAAIGKVDGRAVGGGAEEIVTIGLNLVERHGQQRLDRRHAHLFAFFAASWAALALYGYWLLDGASGRRTAI
jgi:hypothetical protein